MTVQFMSLIAPGRHRQNGVASFPSHDGPENFHLLYSFPNRVGSSGIGMTAWHQLAELVNLGVRITLFCGSCERPVPGIHRVVETMRVLGLPLPYRLLGKDRSFRLHDGIVARELAKRGSDVTAIHCWPRGSLESLQVARACGVRSFLERPNTHTAFAYEVVAREHEMIGLPVPRTHTHAFNAERLAREEAEYALAEQLLCPSEMVATTFRDRGFSAARLARHQYGYSPTCFNGGAQRTGAAPFTALFVGRCEPRKGLHYALQAWHQSGAAREGRFMICGDFVPGYQEMLKPLIAHPSVEVRGFRSDIGLLMREADVLLTPSIEEGSALVTYEARGAGCVVLASDAAGAMGTHGTDILIHETGDVDELAWQLEMLCAEPALLERLRRGSQRLAPYLTWSQAARVLLKQYRAGMHNGCGAGAPSCNGELPGHRNGARELHQ